MSAYVFGYGSLMNARSAGRALKRDLAPGELIPVHLRGFRRTWSLRERVHAEALGREVPAVFLDIGPAAGSRLNGVLVEVSDEAFARLRQREKNYDPLNVTGGIEGAPATDTPVYTFVAKPGFRVREGEAGLFVMERYLRMIDEACTALGPVFAREYAASTEPVPHARLDGAYRFVDPLQAEHA